MSNETQSQVQDYIKQNGPVSVSVVKRELKISKPNVVEQVVLRGLNTGKFELTPKGIKVRPNA